MAKETSKPAGPDLATLADKFEATELEWRVAQAGKGSNGVWAKVLCYVTARGIMDRLDAVCGPGGWQTRFEPSATGMSCGIGIRMPDGEWVWKWDGAGHLAVNDGLSASDAGKGDFSNALKRAGYQWGIGRYLYKLDEAWAKVAHKDDRGSRYGKLPRDKGGDVFYWLPPELPTWARPTAKSAATAGPVVVGERQDETPDPATDVLEQERQVWRGLLRDLKVTQAQREAFAKVAKSLPNLETEWTQADYSKAHELVNSRGADAFVGALAYLMEQGKEPVAA